MSINTKETILRVQTLRSLPVFYQRNGVEKKKWKVFWTFDLGRHFFLSSLRHVEKENFLMNKKIEFSEE